MESRRTKNGDREMRAPRSTGSGSSSRLTAVLARDPCHYVRPVCLEPGHSLRPVDDTLEGVPGQILHGFWLKSLRGILNEVVQTFVSWSTLEGFRNRSARPPSLGQIDNA